MASDAEIDLVVNATRALATVQRDLDDLVRTAENNTDPVQVQAALNRIISLNRVQDDLNQVIRTAQANADPIRVRADVDTDDADRDTRTFSDGLNRLAGIATSILGPLASLGAGIGVAGAAAGTAVPLMAGLAVAVESIIPAAALAASGLLTLQLASATLKIGMLGVKEAIATAFDPEATPEELAESLEKLGPHARSFVKELQGMRKGFKALQIDVQNRLFANLDTRVDRLAKSVLPSVHGALDRTADSLNDMAKGAADAAVDLGDSGVLGQALASSTKSLSLLERIPGQAVSAFGKLAAAAGPAMEGLATRVGGAADRISEKLAKAFESGALEKAINVAVSNIDQLFRSLGNFFKGLGNIMDALSVDGQGLFSTLEKITQAFEDLTASKEFQDALRSLSQTMNVLVTTVLPLLKDAFAALLPVIETLAPPVQDFIKFLGIQLQPVIEELKPVLEQLAIAFGKLLPGLKPIVELGSRLAVLILPILGKLFEFLGDVFERLAPLIKVVADNVARQLEPILREIPGILDKILPKLLELADRLLPLLVKLLEEMGPELTNLAEALADLLVELTPLIVKFLEFQIFLVDKMLPIIKPLVEGFGKALVGALRLFTDFINQFVIPTIKTIVALLSGDWTQAMRLAGQMVVQLRENASRAFQAMKDRMISIAGQLLVGLVNRASQIRSAFVSRMQSLVADAVARIARLPQMILDVLSGMGSLLFQVGQDIIGGLVNGISSGIGRVAAAARRVADSIPGPIKSILGISSPSRVMMDIGDDVMAGLLKGIGDSLPELRAQITGIATVIPQSVAQPTAVGVGTLDLRPTPVNVFIGNERLNQHIDFRVDDSRRRETLITAHGRRR